MSDCYSYHHFYYYYGCDSHYDSSSDLNSYDPNPRQINEITFWKKEQKWPTGMTREVTHGSDPRWVTSAPGGPKNLLIDHHNNNAAVARSARRKKSSFWPGDASEDASFNFIVFVSSERWTLGQGNSWVIPANAPRRRMKKICMQEQQQGPMPSTGKTVVPSRRFPVDSRLPLGAPGMHPPAPSWQFTCSRGLSSTGNIS